MGWFLYDRNLRHKRVKPSTVWSGNAVNEGNSFDQRFTCNAFFDFYKHIITFEQVKELLDFVSTQE